MIFYMFEKCRIYGSNYVLNLYFFNEEIYFLKYEYLINVIMNLKYINVYYVLVVY